MSTYHVSLAGSAARVFAGWLVLFLPTVASLEGQSVLVRGNVHDARTGAPVQGAQVSTSHGIVTQSDASGLYTLSIPPGRHELAVEGVGWQRATRTVNVDSDASVVIDFALEPSAVLLPAVVATATGERRRLNETAAAVGVISAAGLRDARPTHPADVMAQIPGVWVSVTGGEGHMTAIRQPQSTKPLYLFLEDGVPTRSTGFFNHNALYEVNLPQAHRVEVLKGPATALHGSDAIGGVINVETRAPTAAPSLEAFLEGGGYGYSRALLSGSASTGRDGFRADLNLTRTDGWRDATGYDRQTGTLRWDRRLGSRSSLQTVVTGSRIDQQTAGASALPREQYLNAPRENRTPISLRNVRAVRFSSAWEYRGDRTFFSVTPFARWNTMELLPNWSLTYDPTLYATGHRSAGVQARGRFDIPSLHADVIGGVDVDYSPGGRTENRLVPTRSGAVFTDYTVGDLIYDYDVTFRGISPYVQANLHPTHALHLTAGLRYDDLGYSYTNKLGELQTGRWRRPGDADPGYRHLSPKLGASLEVAEALNLYGNYTHGFRAPSEGQLFRQGSASNTLGLDPVTANSMEIGARGQILHRLGYSIAAYRMRIDNDILDFIQPDGTPETQNAGRTLHRGVEVGLTLALPEGLDGSMSYSHARHEYIAWSPRPTIDYSGNEMESAPNSILNARLGWSPPFVEGSRLGVDFSRLGSFWMDADNTHRYDGHSILDLSLILPLPGGIRVNARVSNLRDERYAETAAFTAARGEEFSPGMPRTIFVGLDYRWER